MPKAIYICYFGLREPLVQTQVIPYLLEICKDRIEMTLLTFDPVRDGEPEEFEVMRADLAAKGIDWHWLPYHKRPSVIATAYDIFRGACSVWRLIGRERIDILHCRIHIPALMAAIARKFSRRKPKLLFDIRGFFPEEYTDAGVWPEGGWLYRTAKRVEKWLLKEADGFVVLTEKAREILFPESAETGVDKFNRPVKVIPCCIDAKRFDTTEKFDRETIRCELNIDDKRVFVYVGSFGGWYLTAEMIDFLSVVHRRYENAFSMILTQRDTEKAENLLLKAGLPKKDFSVESLTPDKVPRVLKAADVAISFIKKCYSKQAASPTKIAEYLAGGLPIVSNSGVGDLDALIEGERVGVILHGFSEQDYQTALADIESILQNKQLPEHCRNIAHKYFDLETVGGESYRRLYRQILSESE